MNEYVKKIIDLYTKACLGDSAKIKFQNWLTEDTLADEKEEALFEWWNQSNPTVTKDTLEALASVKSKAQQIREGSKKRLIIWRYAAAIVLILCSTTVYLFSRTAEPDAEVIEYFTQAGEMDTIHLPDGSIIQTNSRTILLYNESFGKDNRTIYLSGEANFKVQKNEELPFIVKSKEFSVTALGTEFDVYSYLEDPYFRTVLISGSVKIQQKGNVDDYTLYPKDQFLYNRQNEEYSISKVDIQEVTAWQRGEFIFRSATIPDILCAMERKYGVSFQYKSNIFNEDKYTFRFKRESSLDDMLEIIKSVSANFDYKQTGESYHITAVSR
ncbi:FecR family protein [Dysgonomonas sp. 25]|uniref:FecR family protein n=1 Tax=Dysgonomonas sp. 25 TaxID=2302933 RepID=UPI0013D697F1|nr:FecR family protein [Dysgonomonas sp. 25]NDV69905.1 FecR family protein [Dysgonomonas sp. 25]